LAPRVILDFGSKEKLVSVAVCVVRRRSQIIWNNGAIESQNFTVIGNFAALDASRPNREFRI
jgi:hypothetical protein